MKEALPQDLEAYLRVVHDEDASFSARNISALAAIAVVLFLVWAVA